MYNYYSSSSDSSSSSGSEESSIDRGYKPTLQDFTCIVWKIIETRSYHPEDIAILPVSLMVGTLDSMCYQEELVNEMSEVLGDPYNVNKILRYYPNARVKLVKFFQWLEGRRGNFVWELTRRAVQEGQQETSTNTSRKRFLGYSSLLRFGTLLMESGWYAESIMALSLAKQQANGDPLKTLSVLRVLLISESLSCRHHAATRTIREIELMLTLQIFIPINLVVALHQAIALSYFESCNFDLSYCHGLIALHLIDEQLCLSSTIVNTLRQMAKSCIAKRRPLQAKLLILQAIAWAYERFGPNSVYYAEVLEDYAFCLLATNDPFHHVYNNALNMYQLKYGRECLRPEVAQGNQALALYISHLPYRGNNQYLLENIVDIEENQAVVLTGSEDRQLMAAKRVKALVAADSACQQNYDSRMEPTDGLEEDIRQLPISIVRSEFKILDVEINYNGVY